MFLLIDASVAGYSGKDVAYLVVLAVAVALEYWYENGPSG